MPFGYGPPQDSSHCEWHDLHTHWNDSSSMVAVQSHCFCFKSEHSQLPGWAEILHYSPCILRWWVDSSQKFLRHFSWQDDHALSHSKVHWSALVLSHSASWSSGCHPTRVFWCLGSLASAATVDQSATFRVEKCTELPACIPFMLAKDSKSFHQDAIDNTVNKWWNAPIN